MTDLSLQAFTNEDLGHDMVEGFPARSLWRVFYKDVQFHDGHTANFLVQIVPTRFGTMGDRGTPGDANLLLVRPVTLRYGETRMFWRAEESYLETRVLVACHGYHERFGKAQFTIGVKHLIDCILKKMMEGTVAWSTVEYEPPSNWDEEEKK